MIVLLRDGRHAIQIATNCSKEVAANSYREKLSLDEFAEKYGVSIIKYLPNRYRSKV